MKRSHMALLTAACTTIMSAGLPVGGMFDTPPTVPYDDNPRRSQGAREFKHKKRRRRAAGKSRRENRRKR